jgi:Protein kinase domain
MNPASFDIPDFVETDPKQHSGLEAMSEKFVTVYTNPATCVRHRISVTYRFNDTHPPAIENQLLRSPGFQDEDEKKKVLEWLYSRELTPNSKKMWPRVTGLEFHTSASRELQWKYYEDIEEDRKDEIIPCSDFPEHIPKIDSLELTDEEYEAFNLRIVVYNGRTCIVKLIYDCGRSFRAELAARIKIGKALHISDMVGVVVCDSLDGQQYIHGMLLEYYPNGDLRCVLRWSHPPVEPRLKERWAVQIAHGISSIHAVGVVHSDIRCSNIVIDDDNNARIIDISNRTAMMHGWYSPLDNWKDPRFDIYSLGVTVWEIIRDGDDLPGFLVELPIDRRGEMVSKEMKQVVEDCVVLFADKRPSLAKVIELLGRSNVCGCGRRPSNE